MVIYITIYGIRPGLSQGTGLRGLMYFKGNSFSVVPGSSLCQTWPVLQRLVRQHGKQSAAKLKAKPDQTFMPDVMTLATSWHRPCSVNQNPFSLLNFSRILLAFVGYEKTKFMEILGSVISLTSVPRITTFTTSRLCSDFLCFPFAWI